ncbi:phosphinothricin acetyltransferase [Nocardioides albertanoniae]|uniref:Phosphinothricin acetyltransferase n=1 Tax=Nocardioides albertanoniae TaxID=1175486 RepID=A0A543AA79_9ACTN|nr:arsinothricin resistance N-acetyltransferase ArsN1 family B [Nocardioides albertanoniae]TQL69485.1 phosphinothricin acetyltransferase [Nocardioides albertanoniae]
MPTTPDRRIRPATADDAAACARIYAPYVENTVVSFETEPPSPEEMARRIEAATAEHAWLVLEVDAANGSEVIGYAYATQHRTRAAYRWACDVSIYLDQDRRGEGAGAALYTALFRALAERGYRRALAGIAIPNEASLGIHRSFGFTEVGTYRRIGWKFDAWHDVTWLQFDL